jgi:predicted N-formylglutamate amidohydrolase
VQLLTECDGKPVELINEGGASDVLLVCEHASFRLPEKLGSMGLSPEALTAHIAWDPGALAVSRFMSESLDATLIYQNFSRLAYDCNRPPEAADAMPQISEIFEIPGNAGLSAEARQARVDEIYRPFEQALEKQVAARKALGRNTVLVTIHSFTPIYKGVARAVEIGILHDEDSQLADAMLAAADASFLTCRNEPYGPADGVTHTLVRHGLHNGLSNVMIEIRNDLIEDEAGQKIAAGFLSGLIRESLPIPA